MGAHPMGSSRYGELKRWGVHEMVSSGDGEFTSLVVHEMGEFRREVFRYGEFMRW